MNIKSKTVAIALTEKEYRQVIIKLQEKEKPGERISVSNFLREIVLEKLEIEIDNNEE